MVSRISFDVLDPATRSAIRIGWPCSLRGHDVGETRRPFARRPRVRKRDRMRPLIRRGPPGSLEVIGLKGRAEGRSVTVRL